jgi:hypothetical protein
MCPLVSSVLDRDTDESASARPRQRTDSDLTAVLHAFFRKRLQSAPRQAVQVRLLARRTLTRLDRRRRSASSGTADRLQKADVLRAALMELRQLDGSPDSRRADEGPIIRRN